MAAANRPIEHHLFCQVHQAMSGVVFSTYDIVKERIEAVATKTGLTVIVRLNLKEYPTGIKVDKQKIGTNNRIQRHQKIPDLNYRINPQTCVLFNYRS